MPPGFDVKDAILIFVFQIVKLNHVDMIGLQRREAGFHILDDLFFRCRLGQSLGGDKDLISSSFDRISDDSSFLPSMYFRAVSM